MARRERSARARQAGGSLLELLFVTLIIGLIAAAALPRLTGVLSPGQTVKSMPTTGVPKLAEALARWTADPETMSWKPGSDLDSDRDRRAYGKMVEELEEADLLDEWRRLLKSRVAADHPLLVALRPRTDGKTPGLVRVGQELKSDPDLAWTDGQPVTVFREVP